MRAESRTRHFCRYVLAVAFIAAALSAVFMVLPKRADDADGQAIAVGPLLASRAMLNSPTSVAVDNSGNIYIADMANGRVRRVDAVSHVVNTVAGTGGDWSSPDNIQGFVASLQWPYGVAVDRLGHLYIAENEGNRIRRIDLSTGKIQTVAGRGWGEGRFSGDGGDAREADLNAPESLATDPQGNVYIADTFNRRIRKWDLVTGTLDTISRLDAPPSGVTVDDAGHLWLTAGNQVKKIMLATGAVTVVAGTGEQGYSGDGGDARKAELHEPRGVAVDQSGNVYVADSFNNRIRKINANTGIISTIAGGGWFDCDNECPATRARLDLPTGNPAIDRQGNVYFADTEHHRVRMISSRTAMITTVAGNGQEGFSGD
ncbi:hypothetical protein KDX01_27350 [Burkholderia vietnamiensis]|uniref:NHL domain-containing protein n=1 Tax=Burkholderia vietnamiensis TaxID=60552 RepID=UPI00075A10E5|nr:hypothetical protein [Burkholderia vietnamiensis]KVE96383.1 hypothetical protein WJ01_11150 [Burkholderia vietnamiensis]MBR7976819.1 hypothetical protein [Burkholderia vietnamiensis]